MTSFGANELPGLASADRLNRPLVPMAAASLLTEALGLLDGERHLLDQLFVALVGRQIQPVEARVRARQPSVFAHLLDAETLRPVAACSNQPQNHSRFTFYHVDKRPTTFHPSFSDANLRTRIDIKTQTLVKVSAHQSAVNAHFHLASRLTSISKSQYCTRWRSRPLRILMRPSASDASINAVAADTRPAAFFVVKIYQLRTSSILANVARCGQKKGRKKQRSHPRNASLKKLTHTHLLAMRASHGHFFVQSGHKGDAHPSPSTSKLKL